MPRVRQSLVHETAVISPKAEIAEDCQIGPFAVIGDSVVIGSGTTVGPHAIIEGPTRIGEGNRIFGPCTIGLEPQDLKYQGEASVLEIGNRNTIREFVTLHRGTAGGIMKTTIGHDNLIMTGVHVAHDCEVGNGTIMGNSATLAGHVIVEDYSRVGAFSGVHQFCRVGAHAFIGPYSVITRDALPYIKTIGVRNEATIYGINQVGLERFGFSSDCVDTLKQSYRYLFMKGLTVKEGVAKIREKELDVFEEVQILLRFVESSERGFVR